jgi:hypothetical protein
MDEEGAIAKLRLALPLGAKHGFERAASEYMFRRTSTDLCAFALKHSIETEDLRGREARHMWGYARRKHSILQRKSSWYLNLLRRNMT